MDAVVVGAGPAGSAVARLLALWGREVVVVTGPPPRRPSLAESLPPSCRKPLAVLGVLEAVEAAGFLPTWGNTAAWGGGTLKSQGFGGVEAGFQVVRQRFDDVLLETARTAGARILRHVVARRVDLPGDGSNDRSGSVHWEGPHGGGRIRARWILDCSGRAGVVARRGLRSRDDGPATVALVGLWRRNGGWQLEDESHTLVESYEDGWAWSVPADQERRCVATMVDPRSTALSRRAGLEGMYGSELAKTVHLRKLLGDATLDGSPWACGATPYGARRHTGPGLLLVGDAGSFLDPLSSFGVKKALASAWLAAVVVHTCISKPFMEDAARTLFEQRERIAHARYSALAGRYYAEAAAGHGHPFWTTRANFAQAPAAEEFDPQDLHRDPRFVAALEQLRRANPLRLRPAAGLRRVARPTVRHREVVLEEHLAVPAVPGGIRYIRGVELPRLVELAQEHEGMPDLYEAYGRVRPPVPFLDFLGALSGLVALGALETVTGAQNP